MMDLTVVGGGVIGLATAWAASRRGMNVALLDPDPGQGASWAAGGMLAPVSEAAYGEEDLLRLNHESARRYPTFVKDLEKTTGRSVGYRKSGSLMVARDGDDAAVLDQLHEFHQFLGLDARWMSPRETRKLEPALARGITAGVLVPGDHQVDNRRLVDALLSACRHTGIRMIPRRAHTVTTEGGRAVGVVDETGQEHRSDTVLVAAGCWSNRLEGIPDELRPPVRPIKGQLLHMRSRPDQPLTDHTVRGLVRGGSFYLVSRGDGRFVLGATVEEMGLDEAVTAGGVYTLLRDAFEVVPGITELELTETVVGFRPGSPDNIPIIGPSGMEGLLFATGHYRNGILLTPLTAQIVVDLLEGRETDELSTTVDPSRFSKEPTWT